MRFVLLLMLALAAAGADLNLGIDSNLGLGSPPLLVTRIAVPSGYAGPTVPVYEDTLGNIYTPFDVATLKPASTGGVTYYVDVATGSDAAAGTLAAPLKTIKTALQKSDVDIIMVKAGNYDRFNGWANATITRSIQVIGYGGAVVSAVNDSALSWAADGANPGSYKAARSNAINAISVDLLGPNGDPTLLTVAASAAACGTTAGTWFTDNTSVWTHRADGTAPTNANTYIMVVAPNGVWTGGAGKTLYVEGITFWGGQIAPFNATYQSGNATATLVFKNCAFGFGPVAGGNALTVVGIGNIYSQNCRACYASFDGFNYHADAGPNVAPKFVEINCWGYCNGTVASAVNNNGSTSHDNALGMRVNCRYFGNQGPQCVDVLGASTWNLGVVAYGSNSGAAGGSHCNFEELDSGTMWLHACTSNISGVGTSALSAFDWLIGTTGFGTGTIKAHNCTFNVGATTGGSLIPY